MLIRRASFIVDTYTAQATLGDVNKGIRNHKVRLRVDAALTGLAVFARPFARPPILLWDYDANIMCFPTTLGGLYSRGHELLLLSVSSDYYSSPLRRLYVYLVADIPFSGTPGGSYAASDCSSRLRTSVRLSPSILTSHV